jgi:multiple sugar transport system permease protein/putative aldouronate transport system permease protein
MKKSKFRYMSAGDKTFTVANYVFLTLIFVVILYPLIYVVSASFSDPQAVISGEVISE